MKDHNQQWNRYREWAEAHVEPDPAFACRNHG
jgi:hypothetical protein